MSEPKDTDAPRAEKAGRGASAMFTGAAIAGAAIGSAALAAALLYSGRRRGDPKHRPKHPETAPETD